MRGVRTALAALVVVGTGFAPLARGQATEQWREWNRPIPPFRIAGPLYYVGVENVTSLLVTTPAGHILVDGGFAESADVILGNVRKLGFRPEDVKVLLSTHAHGDHAGGLAAIKARTGAKLYAGALDVPLLARGGKGDFAFGDDIPYPPVSADVGAKDGETVTLGGVTVRAIASPGHTMGCTSWAFTVDDGGRAVRVVMIGGTSAPGYKLVDNEKYPGIVDDYERTFARLAAEPADLLLEGHGFAFGLDEKRAGRKPFVDAAAYRARVAEATKAFREQLAKERGATASAGR
jgi:metallo-beta-lactamase class B